MLKLRWLYVVDGMVLLITGFGLGGWSNSGAGMTLLGMTRPGEYLEHLPEWRAVGFAGELGGALMAFGFAALAVAHLKDSRAFRTAAPYFLAGHFFLSFLVWAKTMAFGATPGGLLLLAVVLYPGAGFLYAVFGGFSWLWGLTPGVGEIDPRIRDAAGQAERSRLAQDLHDSVKQQVYAIQTSLATAQARWSTDLEAARNAVDHARSTAREAMTEMTALLDRLRRDPIEGVGLIEALRRQGEALGYQSGAEVTMRFDAMPEANQVPRDAMTAVFRIAQEGLANVAKHARANHVELRAGLDTTPNALLLEIADDGQGFDPASCQEGMGLANIRDRATEIGAFVDISSHSGGGCRITLRVPLLNLRRERQWRHAVSLVVSMIVVLTTGLLTWAWVESRAYLLPLVQLAGGVAVFHAIRTWSLRWRTR